MNPQFFQKPVKHNGRNGFDLSSNHVFDMRPSVLRPVIVQDTVPNSSYRINCIDLVRTGALQRAAFLRGRQEIDFFFVPYSQVFTGANEIIFGRSDPHSVRQPLDDTALPKFNLGNLIYYAGIPYLFARLVADIKAFNPTWFYSFNNLQLPNLINLMIAHTSTISDSVILRICRQLFYNAFSVRQELNSMVFVGADCLHLLSTSGYGDYLNLIDSVFVEQENDIRSFFQGTPQEISQGFPVFFEDLLYEWQLKIQDNVSYFEIDTPVTSNPSDTQIVRMVTLLRLNAYQKIFKDYYRDSVNDDSSIYLYASSCDYSSLTSFYANPFSIASGYTDDKFFLLTILRPRLSQFAKDLSTGCYASAQFGNFAKISDTNRSDYSGMNLDPAAAAAGNSALGIRFTLALQRYRETLLRAGNRTKDLLMSEFGVQSHYIADTYVKHLGSFGGNLELNKVEATAETGTYSVGDLAGNIFSSLQGDTIDFTCNDHGFIIGVMRFVCNPLHNAFGINPFLFKSKQFDFYHEEFENLGLQAVSSDNFTPCVPSNDTISPVTIGFSARYNEYKQNLDFAHDSFTGKFPLFVGLANGIQVDGINSNYVTIRDTLQSVSNIRERSYMLPNIMDSIFREVDTGLSESYHFQVTLSCSISAVLPMSVMGLPTN